MTVLKTSMRNFFAHKGRMALSAVAVLLSVGFVCGTLVFTDTMNTTFDKLFSATAADVTVSPKGASNDGNTPDTGKPESLPASMIKQVAAAKGVTHAEGAVSSTAVTVANAEDKDIGPNSGGPTIVGNWTRNDSRWMKITTGHAPTGPGQIMLDKTTADKHHVKLGDTLRVITVVGDFRAKVSGISNFTVTNPGAGIFYLDTTSAQKELLGTTGRFTNVYASAAKGLSNDQLKQNVAATLHGGSAYKLQTAKENADASRDSMGSVLKVMKYAMLGFAGIALLVGIFLIVNTFSMLVAQRTREIGLMRALGSSRRQVNRSVLIEALMLGVFGSVLGVGAGVGLAVGLMKLMGAAGMDLSTSDLTIKATTPVVGIVLGVVVTVLAAYLPARRAGKISPMAALREVGLPADGRSGKVRAVIGTVLSLIGVGGLFGAAAANKAASGSMLLGVGVLCTLVGFVLIGPLLASVVVRLLSAVVLRIFGPVGRMAERNALRNPRRTGATGAALMIGLALVACLSVVGSSMVASASDELDKSVGADFIIQSKNQHNPINEPSQKAMAAAPDIDHLTQYRMVDTEITAADGSTVKDQIVAANPSYAKDLRRKTVSGNLLDAYGKNAISVGDKYAKKHHVKIGDTLSVAFKKEKGRTAKLKVAAITSDDSAFDQGAKYTNLTTAQKYVPAAQMPGNMMMFAEAKNGQEKQAYKELKQALRHEPQIQVKDQADFKKQLKDQIGQLLNIVYGLLALAIIVAVLGVVNTLALSVVERTREIGLMRAIGLSRRQLRRMIRLESVVIALFGALVGLALGMGWGTTAHELLALEGLKTLSIPWPTIITVFIGSAFVGLFAALVPAFRAGRMNVLKAIASD